MFHHTDLLQRRLRLNPFEFRAGICLVAVVNSLLGDRLNPFEFRAGICFQAQAQAQAQAQVLIPLNSGLVFV